MKALWSGVALFTFITAGFAIALFGEAQAESPKDSQALVMGNANSPVEVYIFTDWFCPACKKAEPTLEKQLPDILKKAHVVFADLAVHDDSRNFIPANLSFMMNDKDSYLKLRSKLVDLAAKEKAPSQAEFEEIAASTGAKYEPLSKDDVDHYQFYFMQIATQYGVDRTPTIVVVNPTTNKQEKLVGLSQVTDADIPALIDKLSK